LSIKEKFLRSIEELNRILGLGEAPVVEDSQKSVSTEEVQEEKKEEAVDVSEAQKSVDIPETQEEQNGGSEAAPEAEPVNQEAGGDEAPSEEDRVKSVQLETLMDMVVKTAEKTAQIGKQFVDAAKSMEEREKVIVSTLTKSISVLCESVDTLGETVLEMKKRMEKFEKEPVRKSVSVVDRFGEEKKKSVNLSDISNRLFDLVVAGSVPAEELARFDATKSVDVLSEQTKKLLNL
jgi:hypothetical protein